jgi:hypothetical protein
VPQFGVGASDEHLRSLLLSEQEGDIECRPGRCSPYVCDSD